MDTPQTIRSETEILYDLSAKLAQPIATPKELLQAVSDYPRAQQYTSVTLMYTYGGDTMPESGEVVASMRHNGTDNPGIGTRYPLASYPFASLWFASMRDLIVIEDIEASAEVNEPARMVARQTGLRATIIMPLYFNNRWIGALAYIWDTPRQFDEKDRRIYTAIGQQVRWRVAALREMAEMGSRIQRIHMLEKDLQSSRNELNQLAAVLQSTNDFVATFTPDGKLLFLNRAGRQLAGIGEAEDVTRLSIANFHPAEWATHIKKTAFPASIQNGIWNGEGFLRHRDGHNIPIAQVITSHKSPDGQVSFFGTIIHDIAEQKKQIAERENLIAELATANGRIQRSEEQIRQIIEYAPQSIAMFDRDMRYLVFNRQWVKGYGLEGKDIIGKSHYEIFPEIGDEWKQIHQRAMQGIVDINEEAPFPRADGDLDWLRWDVRPWYQPDGTVGGIMMNTDVITERVKGRQERDSLIRQLREAARFKDEFLAMMSHELRTPLNAMIGLLGIVLMGNRVIDQDRNMITRARSNSERLLMLINNILDISRMEAGRLEIVTAPVSLRHLAEKFSADMSILASQKSVAFTVAIDPMLPEFVKVDEDAITKIITNLVGNAFKFTERGAVALKISKDDESLVIEVRDTGIGIPAHMQEIIFESFRQADASSTRAYGGSGLGLSIVRTLCIAMGGTVRVESKPGAGSTFTVTLPLEVEQPVLN